MRFVSYDDENGTLRSGVVADDTIHAIPTGTTLLGLLCAGEDRLREAGERALASPGQTLPYSGTRLRAPIPTPPTVRDFMTFERHIAGSIKMAGPDAEVPKEWYD